MPHNVSCMGSGVFRHGQLQIGTYHWKIQRIFQVGEDKPLLIHILSRWLHLGLILFQYILLLQLFY